MNMGGRAGVKKTYIFDIMASHLSMCRIASVLLALLALLLERGCTLERGCAVNCEKDVLIGAEANAKAASTAPHIVASVVVHPVGYGEGHAVEEHVAREVLVCLARHDHNAVVLGLPVRHNYHIPVAEVEVDVVVAVAERTLRAANLLRDLLCKRSVAGKNDGVSGVAEDLAILEALQKALRVPPRRPQWKQSCQSQSGIYRHRRG